MVAYLPLFLSTRALQCCYANRTAVIVLYIYIGKTLSRVPWLRNDLRINVDDNDAIRSIGFSYVTRRFSVPRRVSNHSVPPSLYFVLELWFQEPRRWKDHLLEFSSRIRVRSTVSTKVWLFVGTLRRRRLSESWLDMFSYVLFSFLKFWYSLLVESTWTLRNRIACNFTQRDYSGEFTDQDTNAHTMDADGRNSKRSISMYPTLWPVYVPKKHNAFSR